jgi:hypothetical protein
MKRHAALLLATFLAIAPRAFAQGLPDALRIVTDPLPAGSRGLAMGGSLLAGADGVSALEANPAAIAPLASREFSMSFFYDQHHSDATFFNFPSSASQGNFSLGELGLAAPFEATRGHLAVGVSFDRVREYNSTYAFHAVNPTSSLFNTTDFLRNPGITTGSTGNRSYLNDYNLAYALALTNEVEDTGAVTLQTHYTQGLMESGTISESGSMKALRFGAGIDIAEGVSVGATLSALFGSNDWNRDYTATRVPGQNIDLDTVPDPLVSANIVDNIHQDQTGVNLKLGLLWYNSDAFRFGLTIETPSYIAIDQQGERSGSSSFAKGETFSSENSNSLPVDLFSYNITTPVKFGAGASGHFGGLTLAASASYMDMTQIRFNATDASISMADLNRAVQNDLRSVLSWQVGAEYVIAPAGMSLRAGYGMEPSPYKDAPSDENLKKLSAGVGFLLGKSTLLEASWRHVSYTTNHYVYYDTTPTGGTAQAFIPSDAIGTSDFSLTLNYRW